MVRSSMAARLAAALAFALCAGLLLAGLCLAQADDHAEPTIREEYRVTINSVGDGHVVDTIRYSREDYREIKKVEKENRGFLTRRFKSDDNTGEVLDFKTMMDDSERSVVITYDKPGYVYNEKETFAVYGVDVEPEKESEHKFSFEEKSTINSEFTLFTDQVILARYVFELPAEALNSRYEADEKAIRYEMPPAAAQVGFFSRHRTVLSAAFGVFALLCAGGAAFLGTRKPVAVPARAGADAAPPAPAASGRQPGVGPSSGFCGKCGHPVAVGKRFCSKCGSSVV